MICAPHRLLSGDQVQENEMAGTNCVYGREEKWAKGFDGNPDGKKSLRRRRASLDGNIKMYRSMMGGRGLNRSGGLF